MLEALEQTEELGTPISSLLRTMEAGMPKIVKLMEESVDFVVLCRGNDLFLRGHPCPTVIQFLVLADSQCDVP